jgi:hypothetical protein
MLAKIIGELDCGFSMLESGSISSAAIGTDFSKFSIEKTYHFSLCKAFIAFDR